MACLPLFQSRCCEVGDILSEFLILRPERSEPQPPRPPGKKRILAEFYLEEYLCRSSFAAAKGFDGLMRYRSRIAFRVEINCSRSSTFMTPAPDMEDLLRGGLHHSSDLFQDWKDTSKVQPSHTRPRHPMKHLPSLQIVRVPVALPPFSLPCTT